MPAGSLARVAGYSIAGRSRLREGTLSRDRCHRGRVGHPSDLTDLSTEEARASPTVSAARKSSPDLPDNSRPVARRGFEPLTLFLERKRCKKSDLGDTRRESVRTTNRVTRRADQTARQKSDLPSDRGRRVLLR